MKTYLSLILRALTLTILSYVFLISTSLYAKENNELIVGADSWAPFRIMEKNSYSGIDFDFINEIEKRYDKKMKVVRTPWARSLINMRNGDTDIMTGVAKREERAKFLHYIEPPYYTCSTVFYVKKGNAHKIKKYEDLKNFLIGQVDNSAYFSPFDTDKNLFKRSVKSEIQLLRMLVANRLEVIIGTDCQVDFDIANMGFQNKIEKALYKPNNNVNLYLTVSKKSKHAKEVDKLSNIVRDIVQEGKVKEFANKYYKQ